jgi:hypothetical protein
MANYLFFIIFLKNTQSNILNSQARRSTYRSGGLKEPLAQPGKQNGALWPRSGLCA